MLRLNRELEFIFELHPEFEYIQMFYIQVVEDQTTFQV